LTAIAISWAANKPHPPEDSGVAIYSCNNSAQI